MLYQVVLKPYRVSYALLFCMTKHTHKEIENTVAILKELIDCRDRYEECIGFFFQEIDVIMLDSCSGQFIIIFVCIFYNVLYVC